MIRPWEQEWSAAATPDVIEQKGALCALVTAQQGRIQEWLSGCGQQYALLAGSQADSPVRGSSGGGPARRLRAGEMAATGPVVKQRQLQQLLAENEHVQSNELRLQHGHEKLVDLQSGDVFSHFQWDDPCDSSAVISAPIEPLIGHFRDPRSSRCNPNSRVPTQSRDYLLFVGLTKTQLQRIYPGRRLLMDFGTGVYPSSLGWLLPRYEALGVTFDEIWAWEAVPVNHSSYWQKVPASVQPKLHFYNTHLVANTSSPYHPIHFIKQYVHPGDFLVIKLDVDNSPVELAFMHAIRDDPELFALVGEIHFEQHYKHSDVPFFGTSGEGVGYRDVLDFFQRT